VGSQIPHAHSILLRHAVKPSLLTAAALVILTGCRVAQSFTCLPSEQAVITETLYFGTAKPGGVVDAAERESFIDHVVIPAFPHGLTSWVASGRWSMATGRVEQETSHVLQLTHKGNEENDAAIQHLIQTYKNEFHQEAAMRVRSPGCRSF
jgi:hypothetical protein